VAALSCFQQADQLPGAAQFLPTGLMVDLFTGWRISPGNGLFSYAAGLILISY
jgi:hypothetical protein